jgi:hypothetical protein
MWIDEEDVVREPGCINKRTQQDASPAGMGVVLTLPEVKSGEIGRSEGLKGKNTIVTD